MTKLSKELHDAFKDGLTLDNAVALEKAGITNYANAQKAIYRGATIQNILTMHSLGITDFYDAQEAIKDGGELEGIVTMHIAGITRFSDAQYAINDGATLCDIIRMQNIGGLYFSNTQNVINQGATMDNICIWAAKGIEDFEEMQKQIVKKQLTLQEEYKMKNTVFKIVPTKKHGVWAFDDANVGLVQEPFVGNVNNMLNMFAEGQDELVILFSETYLPNASVVLHKSTQEGGGGTWYYMTDANGQRQDGWLCPALFKYFKTAPDDLYFNITPVY